MMSIMTQVGCCRFTVTPTQNGVSGDQTISPKPDSLLGELTKTSESRISETTSVPDTIWGTFAGKLMSVIRADLLTSLKLASQVSCP